MNEHGLVAAKFFGGLREAVVVPGKITAAGLDFLADDGGLSAVLGVVTIKLHEDTLRAILLKGVQEAPTQGPKVESRLRDAIRSLPAKVTNR